MRERCSQSSRLRADDRYPHLAPRLPGRDGRQPLPRLALPTTAPAAAADRGHAERRRRDRRAGLAGLTTARSTGGRRALGRRPRGPRPGRRPHPQPPDRRRARWPRPAASSSGRPRTASSRWPRRSASAPSTPTTSGNNVYVNGLIHLKYTDTGAARHRAARSVAARRHHQAQPADRPDGRRSSRWPRRGRPPNAAALRRRDARDVGAGELRERQRHRRAAARPSPRRWSAPSRGDVSFLFVARLCRRGRRRDHIRARFERLFNVRGGAQQSRLIGGSQLVVAAGRGRARARGCTCRRPVRRITQTATGVDRRVRRARPSTPSRSSSRCRRRWPRASTTTRCCRPRATCSPSAWPWAR